MADDDDAVALYIALLRQNIESTERTISKIVQQGQDKVLIQNLFEMKKGVELLKQQLNAIEKDSSFFDDGFSFEVPSHTPSHDAFSRIKAVLSSASSMAKPYVKYVRVLWIFLSALNLANNMVQLISLVPGSSLCSAAGLGMELVGQTSQLNELYTRFKKTLGSFDREKSVQVPTEVELLFTDICLELGEYCLLNPPPSTSTSGAGDQ